MGRLGRLIFGKGWDTPSPKTTSSKTPELEQAENNWRTWYAPACEAQKRGEGWNALGRVGESVAVRTSNHEIIPFKEVPADFDYPRSIAKLISDGELPTRVERPTGVDTLANGNGPERPLPSHLRSSKKRIKRINIPLPRPKDVRAAFSVNWQPWGPTIQFHPEKIGVTSALWEKYYTKQRVEDSRLFL